MAVVKEAGIEWELARTWPGDRARERQLKNQGGAAQMCPLCGIKPRTPEADREAEDAEHEETARAEREVTLYRDDSTAQVVYDRVKTIFWTAGNTVLVISRYAGLRRAEQMEAGQ